MAESEGKQSEQNSTSADSTKVELADAVGEGAELPLEELDKVIASSDPEFAADMASVAQEKFNNDILDDSAFEYTLEIEIKSWEQKKGFAAKVFKVFPGIAKINFLIIKTKNTFQSKFVLVKQKLLLFLKSIGPYLKAKINSIGSTLSGLASAFGTNFKEKSKWGKVWFVSLLLFSIASLVASVMILYKGMLAPPKSPFLSSLEEWAVSVDGYNPETEVESFYDSTKVVQNVFSLNRIVANVKRSTSSGENPMVAFEFILEGNSSDAVIEVKDREAEVRDLFQRIIEGMSFDQLASSEGKLQLADALRRASNRVLTNGKIRRIYIKTAIVKP